MILALDPGRDKTGWALIRAEGDLVLSGIFPTEGAESFFSVFSMSPETWENALERWVIERCSSVGEGEALDCVVLGDGTGSDELSARTAGLGVSVFRADEKGTTLAARDLYWRLHRPAPWQRLLPRSLRVPPRILDDLAAWAIALRRMSRAGSGGDGRRENKRAK